MIFYREYAIVTIVLMIFSTYTMIISYKSIASKSMCCWKFLAFKSAFFPLISLLYQMDTMFDRKKVVHSQILCSFVLQPTYGYMLFVCMVKANKVCYWLFFIQKLQKIKRQQRKKSNFNICVCVSVCAVHAIMLFTKLNEF